MTERQTGLLRRDGSMSHLDGTSVNQLLGSIVA